jgi:hypothetical protein
MVAMVAMVVMFPTRCEKCQRQKIYAGRNIAPITTIATIMEYDGGLIRADAEMAAGLVRRYCKALPHVGNRDLDLFLGCNTMALATLALTTERSPK